MCLFLATVMTGVIFILASHTYWCFGSTDSSSLGAVWHGRSSDGAGYELEIILVNETHVACCVASDTTFIEGDADIGGIPWDIGVSISDAAEFTGLIDLFASFANWKLSVREGNVDGFLEAWDDIL